MQELNSRIPVSAPRAMDEMPGRSMDDLPHPLMLQTMDTFQSVVDDGLTEVVLTHINSSNPALDDGGPQQAEIARKGFTLAREGMTLQTLAKRLVERRHTVRALHHNVNLERSVIS